MAKSKILNVRTTENEYEKIKMFAAFQGLSMTDFVLESIYEKIEDWEDIQTIREYENDKSTGKNTKRYTLDDVIKGHEIVL